MNGKQNSNINTSTFSQAGIYAPIVERGSFKRIIALLILLSFVVVFAVSALGLTSMVQSATTRNHEIINNYSSTPQTVLFNCANGGTNHKVTIAVGGSLDIYEYCN